MKVHIAKLWLVGMVMAACVIWSDAPANAQDAKAAKADAKAEAKKAPAKPRGRLPAYFNQVVTPQQREQIYALQKPIIDKIDALEAQIKELQAQLEKESRGVLTADQIKKIDELAAATQEKIKAAKAAGAATPEKAPEAPAKAPAKPATPAAAKK
jgi:DNA-directed RNA polymerase alpha subunit